MDRAYVVHHTVVRKALRQEGGYENLTEGDSFIVSFHDAPSAVRFALASQSELLDAVWPEELLLHPDACEVLIKAFGSGPSFSGPAGGGSSVVGPLGASVGGVGGGKRSGSLTLRGKLSGFFSAASLGLPPPSPPAAAGGEGFTSPMGRAGPPCGPLSPGGPPPGPVPVYGPLTPETGPGTSNNTPFARPIEGRAGRSAAALVSSGFTKLVSGGGAPPGSGPLSSSVFAAASQQPPGLDRGGGFGGFGDCGGGLPSPGQSGDHSSPDVSLRGGGASTWLAYQVQGLYAAFVRPPGDGYPAPPSGHVVPFVVQSPFEAAAVSAARGGSGSGADSSAAPAAATTAAAAGPGAHNLSPLGLSAPAAGGSGGGSGTNPSGTGMEGGVKLAPLPPPLRDAFLARAAAAADAPLRAVVMRGLRVRMGLHTGVYLPMAQSTCDGRAALPDPGGVLETVSGAGDGWKRRKRHLGHPLKQWSLGTFHLEKCVALHGGQQGTTPGAHNSRPLAPRPSSIRGESGQRRGPRRPDHPL
jgi:class 3 adenylate cyclase